MHRTHTCWELDKSFVWKTVTLAGWVQKRRDLGWMIFIDLRDRYWITQITLDPQRVDEAIMKAASEVTHERVIKIEWEVVARPDSMINSDMATGEVELVATTLEVLNRSKELPFMIVDDPSTSEEQRMKHRYIDLRRNPVLENIKLRARLNKFTRDRYTQEWFLEVQTPIFTVSSPEWSRDYLVPSRVNPGKFYALPQAPQQYKQLLMVGWVDKYFQIAPCFRDEDPRSDRAMCEFYQVDLEMSFVEQEDVMAVLQWYSLAVAKEFAPQKKRTFGDDFPRISYRDAMDYYGIDRPDLRFDMKIADLTETFSHSGFGVFKNSIADGGIVRAITLKWQSMTRKELDAVTDVAKRAWAWWLAYLIFEEEGIRSPILKFLSEKELADVAEKTGAVTWDIVFFGAWSYDLVCKVLHTVRIYLRDLYELVDKNELAFCFVVDFPFFEVDEETGEFEFGHNPFSRVVWGVEALESLPIHEIMTNQYDVVLNWYEIWWWSIRNHETEVLLKVFEKVWRDEQEVKERFGALYEAFQYGCPPHGGCAFGFDRFMMVLADEPNIRECYAFPKSWRAEDTMMWAPAVIDDAEQLKELSITVTEATD